MYTDKDKKSVRIRFIHCEYSWQAVCIRVLFVPVLVKGLSRFPYLHYGRGGYGKPPYIELDVMVRQPGVPGPRRRAARQ